MIKAIGTTAAALLLAGALVPSTATAAPAASCALGAGAVTSGGDHRSVLVSATTPPTARDDIVAADVYAAGQVRVSASMNELDDGFDGVNVFGYVIIGDGLYVSGYHATNGTHDGAPATRIGGGWGSFVALEEAEYQGPTDTHITSKRWESVIGRHTSTSRTTSSLEQLLAKSDAH